MYKQDRVSNENKPGMNLPDKRLPILVQKPPDKRLPILVQKPITDILWVRGFTDTDYVP